MIGLNQNKIANKKIKNKAGGDANESRFFRTERELRKHKVMIAPSANTDEVIKFEQGWNKKARKKDVVRVSIGNIHVITYREDLEQAIANMAQGDEMLKYQAPRFN